MRKQLLIMGLAAALVAMGGRASLADGVGLPTTDLRLSAISGWADVCVWDATGAQWVTKQTLWRPTTYGFTASAWSRWYWVGVWDYTSHTWRDGAWVAHFKTKG